MRKLLAGVFALGAIVASAPADAQRFIPVAYDIGTQSDSISLVDLDRVERSGELASALSFIEYVELFRIPSGVRVNRQYVRIQFDCRTNQLRRLLVQTMTQTVAAADWAAAKPDAFPADSVLAMGMCRRPGELKAPWALLNSEFTAAPEKRRVLFTGAQKFPWNGMTDAKQSFMRIRAQEMFYRANEGANLWPSSKPVPGFPTQGFAFTALTWAYEDTGTGPATFSGGFVELPTVAQTGPNQYFYSLTTMARPRFVIEGIEPVHHDLGVEVRCGPKPVQRISGMEFFHPSGSFESVAVPLASLKWQEQLFSFSADLCTRRFNKTAKRVGTTKEAVAELLAAYRKS